MKVTNKTLEKDKNELPKKMVQKGNVERKWNGILYIPDHQNSLSLSEDISDNINSGKKKQKKGIMKINQMKIK